MSYNDRALEIMSLKIDELEHKISIYKEIVQECKEILMRFQSMREDNKLMVDTITGERACVGEWFKEFGVDDSK